MSLDPSEVTLTHTDKLFLLLLFSLLHNRRGGASSHVHARTDGDTETTIVIHIHWSLWTCRSHDNPCLSHDNPCLSHAGLLTRYVELKTDHDDEKAYRFHYWHFGVKDMTITHAQIPMTMNHKSLHSKDFVHPSTHFALLSWGLLPALAAPLYSQLCHS